MKKGGRDKKWIQGGGNLEGGGFACRNSRTKKAAEPKNPEQQRSRRKPGQGIRWVRGGRHRGRLGGTNQTVFKAIVLNRGQENSTKEADKISPKIAESSQKERECGGVN